MPASSFARPGKRHRPPRSCSRGVGDSPAGSVSIRAWSRPPPPSSCSARRASRRSTRQDVARVLVDRLELPVRGAEDGAAVEVRTGSSSSGRSSRSGRYSFAFSSHPVAQTSSNLSASRRRRAPARPRCSGRSVHPLELPGGGPRRVAEQADHAVDVDEKDGRLGFFWDMFARLRGEDVSRGALRGKRPIGLFALKGGSASPDSTNSDSGTVASLQGPTPFFAFMTVQIGILLALLCAFFTNLGFLFKHRGACAAPDVEWKHPLRSARSLWTSKWFAIGMGVAIGAWLFHVAAMALAPLSLVQAVISAGSSSSPSSPTASLVQRRPPPVGRRLHDGAGPGAPRHHPPGHRRRASSYSHAAMISFEAGLLAVGGFIVWSPSVRAHEHHGVFLGAAAGIMFGVSDIAIKALTGAGGATGILGSPWLAVTIMASVIAFYVSGQRAPEGGGRPGHRAHERRRQRVRDRRRDHRLRLPDAQRHARHRLAEPRLPDGHRGLGAHARADARRRSLGLSPNPRP